MQTIPINQETKRVLEKIKKSEFIGDFYLDDYNQLYPFIEFNAIKLADERDIAGMKIDAISSRGSKKDFIDLYFLLEKYSLSKLISFFEKKYSNIEFNKLYILKSLTYFADAEDEPMPIMIKKAEWNKVKEKIINETKKIIE